MALFFPLSLASLALALITLFRFTHPRLGGARAMGVTVALGGSLSLCLCAAFLLVIGAFDSLFRPSAPAALLGEWACVDPTMNCWAETEMVLGDVMWRFGPTIFFAHDGNGWWYDGTVASGNLTCDYDGLEGERLSINCGFGWATFNYRLNAAADRLTLWFSGRTTELKKVGR
jgi:hypothetical protein